MDKSNIAKVINISIDDIIQNCRMLNSLVLFLGQISEEQIFSNDIDQNLFCKLYSIVNDENICVIRKIFSIFKSKAYEKYVLFVGVLISSLDEDPTEKLTSLGVELDVY